MRASRAMLIAFALLVPTFKSHAQLATELTCLPARTLVGDNIPAPGYRVVKTYVNHTGAGWRISHTLENNYVVNRSAQYAMEDISIFGGRQQWRGVLERNPSLYMIGEIQVAPRNAAIFYIESIYDQDKSGTLVMKTIAECSLIRGSTLPEVSASPSLSVAQPVGGGPELATGAAGPTSIVSMLREGGTFVVPVTINGQITLKFVVDSGAADVSVPADVVMTLIRTGTLTNDDFLGAQTYKLADGSTLPSEKFVIRSIKIGDRVVENVTGDVAPITGGLLLGQSLLGRFHSWSIDNQKEALILE